MARHLAPNQSHSEAMAYIMVSLIPYRLFFIAYVPCRLLRHHHDDRRHGVVVACRVVLQRPPEPVLIHALGRRDDLGAKDIIDIDHTDVSPLACQGGDTRLYIERAGDEARIIGHHLVTVDCLGHRTNDRIEPALAMEQLSQYRGTRPENNAEGSCQLDVCLDLPRCFHRIAVPVNELSTTVPCVGACLLYTSDAADDLLCVDLGGRRIIKKKKKK